MSKREQLTPPPLTLSPSLSPSPPLSLPIYLSLTQPPLRVSMGGQDSTSESQQW